MTELNECDEQIVIGRCSLVLLRLAHHQPDATVHSRSAQGPARQIRPHQAHDRRCNLVVVVVAARLPLLDQLGQVALLRGLRERDRGRPRAPHAQQHRVAALQPQALAHRVRHHGRAHAKPQLGQQVNSIGNY